MVDPLLSCRNLNGKFVHHYLSVILDLKYKSLKPLILPLHDGNAAVGKYIVQKYDEEVVIPALISICRTGKEEESAKGPGCDTETENKNEGIMDDVQSSNDISGVLGEFEEERMRKFFKMELSAYRRTRFPTTASPTERLIWLRKQNMKFPNITSLARHNLGIPPTQIENERVFSRTGRIATPPRNRSVPLSLICSFPSARTILTSRISRTKMLPRCVQWKNFPTF